MKVFKALLLPGTLFGSCLLMTAERPTAFTAAQAEAGKTAYEQSCGQCHTPSLLGRKGDAGEVPPIASLPQPYQEFIGPKMRVPPLIGKDFVAKYGDKRMSAMFTLFRGAADSTPVKVLQMSDDTLVNITAYILLKNGGLVGDQPLTKATTTFFGSLAE